MLLPKATQVRCEIGITQRLNTSDIVVMIDAPTKYGHIKRRKLIPPESIATISVRCANFEVKKIQAINVNSALN
jgi:hypothetical protein